MHQTVVNLLLEVDTPSRKRLSKKIMEELKCYGVEFKKKVMMYLMFLLMKFHILRKLIRIKKLVHNGHTEKIINDSKHPFLPHFSNPCHNPYPQILYSFDSLMCLCLSHTHDIICFLLRA